MRNWQAQLRGGVRIGKRENSKIKACFVVFLIATQYKQETTGQGKNVRVFVRTAVCKTSIEWMALAS